MVSLKENDIFAFLGFLFFIVILRYVWFYKFS